MVLRAEIKCCRGARLTHRTRTTPVDSPASLIRGQVVFALSSLSALIEYYMLTHIHLLIKTNGGDLGFVSQFISARFCQLTDAAASTACLALRRDGVRFIYRQCHRESLAAYAPVPRPFDRVVG